METRTGLVYYKYDMCNITELKIGDSGAVLIGLLVAMVIISAMGAAMLSQTSTGIFSLVGDNNSVQAYYLAESGLRYAAAKMKHNGNMDVLHNHGEYVVGNTGGFSLTFNPYIFYITGGDGTAELVTTVPFGDAPPISATAEVGDYYYVKMGVVTEAFDSVSVDTSPNDNIVRFTKAGNWSVTNGQRVQLVVKSDGTSLSEDGDLILQNTSPADLFPARNGYIIADNKTYRYEKRETDRLSGITRVGAAWGTSPTLSDGDDIVLKSFTMLFSTGRVGTGGMTTTREITYSIPLSESDEIEFHDMFDDRTHWATASSSGSHAIETIEDNKALKVTGTSTLGADEEKSLIYFDSSTADIDFERARGVSGGYLSYDVQVKTGFDPVVPGHYMAGISFRLNDTTGNSYGVSFQHADCIANDGIPDDFVTAGVCGNPGIVVWQDTGTGRDWLAWRKLTPLVLFFDDMENGVSGWIPDSPWDQDTGSGNTWWSDSPGVLYENNLDISLTSQSFDLSKMENVTLKWLHRYDIEPRYWFFTWIWRDWGAVEISLDGGSNWDRLTRYEGAEFSWTEASIAIPAIYLTDNVRIRFRLETNGSARYGGWLIDDIRLEADYFPIDDATLLVQVVEAARVNFINGTVQLEDGDLLVSEVNNAKGIIIGDPIIASGSWAGGDAEGVIQLNNVTNTFPSGSLKVDGKGTGLASATGFGIRDNYIQVYYGNSDGYGIPSDNPIDYSKHGLPRIATDTETVKWPPDLISDTTSANDYFTLVKWDDYNSAEASLLGGGVLEDTIIRTSTLTTAAGAVSDPELGLHTFGQGDFSANVFFDDFAIQSESPTASGFYPVVQE
jgi:hypothetical protein